MITIKDIARVAGVSNSTVSRALRDDPKIADETRERIKQTAKDLGYQPNPMVNALMSHLRAGHPPAPTCNLCWLDFGETSDQWKDMPVQRAFYEGACARASASRYALERIWVRAPGLTPARLAQILRARNISGVLIPYFEGSQGQASSIPLPLEEFNIVSVGAPFRNPDLHYASNDQYASTRTAVRQLWKLGYQRIGYIGHPNVETAVLNRFCAAYHATLVFELRIPSIKPLISDNPKEISAWIRLHRPEAVITSHLHSLVRLREEGWRIPEELGVAATHVERDDDETSGIYQNSEYVGSAAVDTLIGQICSNEQGVPPHPKGVMIPGTWMPGRTVRQIGHRDDRANR